jgi:pSer/pThr/pTyr-binding forkhead associated (FHA) protein
MASLCLLDENGIMSRRWELGDKPLAVGRGKTADVVIEDATLSRRHFVVEREGEVYLLKDLNSQNGTWVDGRRAQSTKLNHHDCILAGRTIFMFSENSNNAVQPRMDTDKHGLESKNPPNRGPEHLTIQ